MKTEKNNISVTFENKTETDETPKVRVMIPLPMDAESGMKVDPYEHVTINGELIMVKRGEYVDVPVPVFMQLKNRYPNL